MGNRAESALDGRKWYALGSNGQRTSLGSKGGLSNPAAESSTEGEVKGDGGMSKELMIQGEIGNPERIKLSAPKKKRRQISAASDQAGRGG